jgi:hypothetical protein
MKRHAMTTHAFDETRWRARDQLETQEEAVDAMPDILYVMGTGRSGTTILEVLLTNDDGITGTGELKHIFRDAFIRDLQCACGKSGHQCELWARVLHSSGWSQTDCATLGKLVEQVESHANFPMVYLGLQNKRAVDAYTKASTTLFRSVARITGSSVIVDSSKYPARALLLERLYPGKVKVLCITRSAAGLITAFQKKNENEQRPKGRFAVVAYYLYVLLCMWLVRSRLRSRCLVIRFEDLNRNPVDVLAKIEQWSGYSLATARAKTASGDWFDVGHIMTGNRLRKKGKVKFDPSAGKAGIPESPPTPRRLSAFLEAYRTLLRF